jgi:hypothetical protein
MAKEVQPLVKRVGLVNMVNHAVRVLLDCFAPAATKTQRYAKTVPLVFTKIKWLVQPVYHASRKFICIYLN